MKGLPFVAALFLAGAASSSAGTFLPYAKFPPARYDTWGYPRAIAVLRQPSLLALPPGIDAWRFVDAPTFDSCIVATLTRRGSRIFFAGIRCGGKAGYNIQGPIDSVTRDLTPKEVKQFLSLLASIRFRAALYIDRGGIDGNLETLEARTGGSYRCLVRFEPDAYPEDRPLWRLGDWIESRIPARHVSLEDTGGHGVGTRDNQPIIIGR